MSTENENVEIIKEVLEINTDVFFDYKGKEYFWTVFGEPKNPRRCLRNGKDGDVIEYFDNANINTPVIDGKTLLELAPEMDIIDVY